MQQSQPNSNFAYQMNSPTPYDVHINLYAYAKNQDDALQIVEQIFPFFNPDLNVTINAVPEMNFVENIPIIFTGCSIYFKVESPTTSINDLIRDNIYEQQLIFTTLTLSSTGEKIVEKLDYGLSEAVTDCDGNVFEVNNDFDFLYNKHWIKKDLDILNLKRIWIGDPATKICELVPSVYYHNRLVNGPFKTGNFAWGTTMEVYETDMSATGNFEANIPGITSHYISPVPSNNYCAVPQIYTLKYETKFWPREPNTLYTAPLTDIFYRYS
jgi:hypothetical protein